ncbi:hypothetical protein FVE85_7430 [Porphyridium purpureum]|uniref:Uncharacterized protein n=1 Tax=Porphyridium purpureum TaxID=35688 RepID=A0A5J4Z936_PORPP|nr:hypothetical protein FVE85_7430 [Porphyridium purpureum]|eukprot:POR8755..scf295_1
MDDATEVRVREYVRRRLDTGSLENVTPRVLYTDALNALELNESHMPLVRQFVKQMVREWEQSRVEGGELGDESEVNEQKNENRSRGDSDAAADQLAAVENPRKVSGRTENGAEGTQRKVRSGKVSEEGKQRSSKSEKSGKRRKTAEVVNHDHVPSTTNLQKLKAVLKELGIRAPPNVYKKFDAQNDNQRFEALADYALGKLNCALHGKLPHALRTQWTPQALLRLSKAELRSCRVAYELGVDQRELLGDTASSPLHGEDRQDNSGSPAPRSRKSRLVIDELGDSEFDN